MELSAFLDVLKNFVVKGLYTINGVMLDGITDNDIKVFKTLFSDIGVEEIAYLLKRLLAIEPRNAEIELITLGYSGLDLPVVMSDTSEDTVIQSVDNEIGKEEQNAVEMIKEEEKVEFNQGLENAQTYFKNVTVDDLIQLGGTLIE